MGFPDKSKVDEEKQAVSGSQKLQNDRPVLQIHDGQEVSYALELRSLSKRFKRQTLKGKSSYTTLKSALLSLFKKPSDSRTTYTEAVNNLTLRVPKGSSVGIIGRNGSGKSSLLKLITGIYKPDSGSVNVSGRVAALIELGAGFHPDFTGRENLHLGGIMYGLSRAEIENRFNEIVAFAELEEVIDDPVRTYSSGMFMRLGFSLAIHVDPEILLIDEVLSVGDAGFTSKCKERITRLKREGKTLLMVSHDLDAVERWCDEVLWMHKGEVKDRGEPRRVIDQYRQFLEKSEEADLFEEKEEKEEQQALRDGGGSEEPDAEPDKLRWGGREVELVSCKLLNANQEPHLLFHTEDSCTLEFSYKMHESVRDIVFGVAIHRSDGVLVYGTNTQIERIDFPALPVTGSIRLNFDRLGFLQGEYLVDIAAHSSEGYPYDYHKQLITFRVKSKTEQVGVCEPPHSWQLIPEKEMAIGSAAELKDEQ